MGPRWKIHRLGLSERGSQDPKQTASVGSARAKKHLSATTKTRTARVWSAPVQEAAAKPPILSRSTTRRRRKPPRRWPVRDPMSPDFRLCGAPIELGQPYCSACAKRPIRPYPTLRMPKANRNGARPCSAGRVRSLHPSSFGNFRGPCRSEAVVGRQAGEPHRSGR
ncbi:GcrA family cell cycle regulator [Martelella alba]